MGDVLESHASDLLDRSTCECLLGRTSDGSGVRQQAIDLLLGLAGSISLATTDGRGAFASGLGLDVDVAMRKVVIVYENGIIVRHNRLRNARLMAMEVLLTLKRLGSD